MKRPVGSLAAASGRGCPQGVPYPFPPRDRLRHRMHQWWYRMTGPLPFSATGPMFRIVSNPAAPETPPLRLQLLGPLAHQGPAATDAYLARPKQAALLAYLACAGAGRLVRRDHLAALFWPELGALGARAETFTGLAGMGDLILTCTGDLSRNRRVGLAIARGEAVAQAQAMYPKRGINR